MNLEELGLSKFTDSKKKILLQIKSRNTKINYLDIIIQNIQPRPCDTNGNVTKRNISDDTFYEGYPHLHKRIPRSYSVLSINKDGKKIRTHTFRGMYKFSGNNILDEDHESNSLSYLVPKNLKSDCKYKLVTEKENGKFALISMIDISGERYVVGGSKNVHRIFKLEEISSMTVNSLDEYIIYTFWEQYQQLDNSQKLNLSLYLSHHSHPKCLCGEFTDGKHMVVSKGKPTIKWFAITDSCANFWERPHLNTNILEDLKQINAFRLPCVKYKLIEYSDSTKDYRICSGKEGDVIHYLDQNYQSIYIEKVKTYWYIIIRCLRQIILNSPNLVDVYRNKLCLTLLKRNSFLNLPEPFLIVWYELLCKFCQWFIENKIETKAVDMRSEGMGFYWKKFMNENPDLTDDFGEPDSYLKNNRPDLIGKRLEINYQEKILVLFQGVPGLGKTTLANNLIKTLGETSVCLEQDQFKGDKNKCLQCLKKLLSNPKINIILLSRNNSNIRQYKSFIDLVNHFSCKVLAIYPYEWSNIDSKKKLIEICQESVKVRTGHPTFDSLKINERQKIVTSFSRFLQPAKIGNGIHFTYPFRWLNENLERRSLIEMTRELENNLPYYLENKPHPIYISLPIDCLDKIKIEKECLGMIEIIGQNTNKYFDHLTLSHSSNCLDRELWLRCINLKKEVIKIEIYALLVKKSKEKVDYLILKCRIEDKYKDLVYSGYPHITGIIPKNKTPVVSLDILRLRLRLRENNYINIDLEKPIIINSQVTLHYE